MKRCKRNKINLLNCATSHPRSVREKWSPCWRAGGDKARRYRNRKSMERSAFPLLIYPIKLFLILQIRCIISVFCGRRFMSCSTIDSIVQRAEVQLWVNSGDSGGSEAAWKRYQNYEKKWKKKKNCHKTPTANKFPNPRILISQKFSQGWIFSFLFSQNIFSIVLH